MALYSFAITEYDPAKPWLVVATGRDSIELSNDQNFHEWARATWPTPRYAVRLDAEPFRWVTQR